MTQIHTSDTDASIVVLGLETRVRSIIFEIFFVVWTFLIGTSFLWTLLLPRQINQLVIKLWARIILFGARFILKLRWSCPDKEALAQLQQKGPMLIAVKHQSAWETIIFFILLHDTCYVLKQDLLKIPIYGWFVERSGMIAIDRNGHAQALKTLIRKTQQAHAEKRCLVVFPEGTRMPVGQHGKINPGILAVQRDWNLPIIPIAHNAGLFWPRRGCKLPGEIILRILPPIPFDPDRKKLNAALQAALFETTDQLVAQTAASPIKDRESGKNKI